MKIYNCNSDATHKGGVFSMFYSMLAILVGCAVLISLCIIFAYPVDVFATENEAAADDRTEAFTTENEAAADDRTEAFTTENEAAAESQTESTVVEDELLVKKKIYHAHTGNPDNGGGCYTEPREEYEQVEVRCSGTLHYWGDEWGTSECNVCGASYTGNRGGESCPHSQMETRVVTKYDIGCGRTGAVVGYVTYRIRPSSWTKEVSIDIEIENNGMRLAAKPYRFNGNSYEEGHFTVTENGKYSLGITADANTNAAAGNYTADISNIDITGPLLKKYSVLPSDWTRDGVDIIFDEIVDLQPDGKEGCGVADEAYSFDGGSTFTALASCHYDRNGTYEFLIKDKLGNEKVNTVTIGNIDIEAPDIIKVEYDDTPNLKSVDVNVLCDDRQSDGSEGCGLDEFPYSFDGGKNWVKDSLIHIDSNRTIDFCVRDRLGNVRSENIIINNLDNDGPTVAHKITPDNWTNGNVTVIFSAKDINKNGAAGVGLPRLCFSYDGGRTWTASPEIEITNNRQVNVLVRDINDNYTYYDMVVDTIDRIPPYVSIHREYDEKGNEVTLIAEVADNLSGVDITSVSWNGQGKYSRSNSLIVNEEGSYIFSVCDRAGNGTESKVNVEDISSPPEEKEPGDDTDPSPKPIPVTIEIPEPSEVPQTPEEKTAITAARRDEAVESTEEMTESEEESTELEVAFAPRIPSSDEHIIDNSDGGIRGWWKGLTFAQRLLVLLLLLLLIILLLLLFFVWTRSVIVICDKNNSGETGSKNECLGIKLIDCKKGHYFIKIDEKMWNKAESTHFNFRFSLIFRLLHSGEDIYISFPEDQIRLMVIGSKNGVNV